MSIVDYNNRKNPFFNRFVSIVATILLATSMLSGIVDAYLVPRSVNSISGANVEPHLVIGNQGAAAVELKECSDAGVDIMKKGGGAVDAAIASTLCIGIVNSFATGIGGGGFMLIRSSNGSYETIDFRETAPAAATRNMFVNNPNASQVGGLAVAIPGAIRGFELAHQRHGKLPWRDLFETSIRIARDGFEVTDYLYSQMKLQESEILSSSDLSKIYASNGTLLEPGQIIKMPESAKTLQTLATKGGNEFYEGDIAKSLVNAIQSRGGIVTLSDMKNYTAIVRPALTTYYNGLKVTTTNAPTCGPALLSILNLIEPYNFAKTGKNGPNMHRLIEAFKFGYSIRTELGDPDFVDLEDRIRQVTNKEWADIKRVNITNDATHDPVYYEPKYDSVIDEGTMHLSVVDKDNGAVSLTSTVNLLFGAKFVDPLTGIILNDEMDDFSIPGKQANRFGLFPNPSNYVEPGKRPLSTNVPTIIEDASGNLKLVVGGSGGSRILSAVINVITNNIDFGMDIFEAIKAPRLHHQLMPNYIEYELLYDEDILEYLRSRGHLVNLIDTPFYVSGSQAIYRFRNGTIHAASEPRKNGIAAAY